MNEIGLKLLEHASIVDVNLKFYNFTGKELKEWMYPLASSITSEGAIPYLLETSNRFRASPLASTISWLDSAGLLPIEVLDKLQDALIMLKDSNIESDTDIGITKKSDDDICGWSLGEGVSVWSTSMAIISLLDNHNNGEKN